MRQAANWDELFAPRHEPLSLEPEMPAEPKGWRRLLWWEDLVTFVLLAAMLFTVMASVQTAGWVDGMPSLFAVAFFGLVTGMALARLRWREGFVHLLALAIGAVTTLAMLLSVLPGATPWDRYGELQRRMHEWFEIAFGGGISNDELPFIVLVVTVTWLASYLSAWAVFRWRNVWLALVPGGVLLLANVAALPGSFSFAFVIYVLGSVLLVTRMHVIDREQLWRKSATPYPQFLSLSVLHATLWMAAALVVLAWLLPQVQEVQPLEDAWKKATNPATERAASWSRLFIAVKGEEAGNVHAFGDILPFLGGIELSDEAVLEVIADRVENAKLRAETYDTYTSTGWEQVQREETELSPEITIDRSYAEREAVDIDVVSEGNTGDTIFTIGQPRNIGIDAVGERTAREADLSSVEAEHQLGAGDEYTVTGSVSTASPEQLRAAGTDYPDWVTSAYLQLPAAFPASVRDEAASVAGAAGNPYDQAAALEAYLREIPYDLDVPLAPAGEDAIEHFLFEAKAGYFDYHASAMVVMLRSLGVPSRLAVGYTLRDEERHPLTGGYRVTEKSAFAWPEVYFPGFGWVEFNPTPGLAAAGVIADEAEAPAIEGETDVPAENAFGLEGPAEPELPDDGASPIAEEASGSRNYALWAALGAVMAVCVGAVAGAGVLRYAWLKGLSDLDTPARLWGQTVRLASWAGVRAEPSATPREHAERLQADVTDLDGAGRLADAYVRQRFGGQTISGEEEQDLETTWQAVRGRLLRRLFRIG
jgi:transglutaminase-like putative cysteine protease